MPEPPPLQLVVEERALVVEPTRRFVIGRGTRADLTLASPLVSRRHAILEFAGIRVHLSLNGATARPVSTQLGRLSGSTRYPRHA